MPVTITAIARPPARVERRLVRGRVDPACEARQDGDPVIRKLLSERPCLRNAGAEARASQRPRPRGHPRSGESLAPRGMGGGCRRAAKVCRVVVVEHAEEPHVARLERFDHLRISVELCLVDGGDEVADAIVLAALLVAGSHAQARPGADPLRVLFVGNS